MKNYIAFWPDDSFTVLSAEDILSLFWLLDEEGNPYDAKVYQLPGRFRIETTAHDGMICPMCVEEIIDNPKLVEMPTNVYDSLRKDS